MPFEVNRKAPGTVVIVGGGWMLTKHENHNGSHYASLPTLVFLQKLTISFSLAFSNYECRYENMACV